MLKKKRVFSVILDASILSPCESSGSITEEAQSFTDIITDELRQMKQRAVAEAMDQKESFFGICECFSLSRAMRATKEADSFIDIGNVLLRELEMLKYQLELEATTG